MVGLTCVYRVVTFVPTKHGDEPENNIAKIIAAVNKVTPLRYGRYDCVCWSSSPGEEQSRPLSGSNSTSGNEGEMTFEPSIKLEFSVPRDEKLLQRVIDEAIVPNHPWEEPVILFFQATETRIQAIE